MSSDLKLLRSVKHDKGAFGVLVGRNGLPFGVSLERTFENAEPVIPAGIYLCRKSRFERGGYDTFEITGVAGHSRLLFHKGNKETDSLGCVLVAEKFEYLDGEPVVLESQHGFDEFWRMYGDLSSFYLEIKDPC